jgi:probable HAF family extracellular repeat protein
VVINNIDLSFLWTPTHSSLNLHPLPGGTFTRALGINRYGLVAGYSNGPVDYHAVVWNEGEPQDLGTLPGGLYSQGYAINASGEVAGGANTATIRGEAMVWTQAMGMQGLGTLAGGSISEAYAINRFGQVVGYSDSNNGTFAFIWSKTTGMKNLGKLPGYDSSSALAINDLGQVAGLSFCANCSLQMHATLWNKGKGSILDLGINNVGQVVGEGEVSALVHAFVWSPSTGMLDLNNLIPANSGWLLQTASAINDQGQIVGVGVLNGQQEAFLLTPQ